MRCLGSILVFTGLFIDASLGYKLLGSISWPEIVLHFLVTLVWAVGIQLITPSQDIWRLQPLTLTALAFGFFTFPGLGVCMYTCSLCLMPSLWRKQVLNVSSHSSEEGTKETPEPSPKTLLDTPRELSPTIDWLVQPLIETLYDSDIELRRVTITILGQSEQPESNTLLRTLLLNPQAEVHKDTSIALAHNEDALTNPLIQAFTNWQSDTQCPSFMLELAEQYYLYTNSQILDQDSRDFYLEKAKDLLLQLLWQDNQNASLWLQLALIRQGLGDLNTALQDACYALQLQPHLSPASLLAMSLAFQLHTWDVLLALASNEISSEILESIDPALPTQSSLQVLNWWADLHKEETHHD